MKLRYLIPALVAAAFVLPAAQAQIKVGVIDMNEAFVGYNKTKDAEAKIKDAQTQAKKELDQRLETLNKAVEEINKIQQEVQKPELSQSAKETKMRDLNDKANDARNLDREVAEFRSTRDRQLQEQYMRMRKDLIDEIMVVVNDKIKAGGYDVVFDKSGMSMGQIPVVLYSRKDMDFTPAVLEALNSGAAKGAAGAKTDKKAK